MAETPISYAAKPENLPLARFLLQLQNQPEIAPRENDAGKEGSLQGWAKALKIGVFAPF